MVTGLITDEALARGWRVECSNVAGNGVVDSEGALMSYGQLDPPPLERSKHRRRTPTGTGGLTTSSVPYFLSADWSKRPDKRSVYLADCRKPRVRRCEPPPGLGWDLDALLRRAQDLARDGPVLVGIDVVLGVPKGYWASMRDKQRRRRPETLVDWLRGLDPSGEFFETVNEPDQWRVDRPWFKVAKGIGARTRFTSQVEGGMRRRIDVATGGNPLFAVAGMPGTVGAGTREVWKELIPHLSDDREFAIWPFEDSLNCLLDKGGVVLCETYPRLAYAVALADELPTKRIRGAKTKPEWRNAKCKLLKQAGWVRENRVDLGELDPPRKNDDDFDAHFTAAAVLRCVCEGRPLADPTWIDEEAEGSMLLTGVSDFRRKRSR